MPEKLNPYNSKTVLGMGLNFRPIVLLIYYFQSQNLNTQGISQRNSLNESQDQYLQYLLASQIVYLIYNSCVVVILNIGWIFWAWDRYLFEFGN